MCIDGKICIVCYGCIVHFFILICWYTCRHKVKKICKAEKKYIPQVGAKIIWEIPDLET